LVLLARRLVRWLRLVKGTPGSAVKAADVMVRVAISGTTVQAWEVYTPQRAPRLRRAGDDRGLGQELLPVAGEPVEVLGEVVAADRPVGVLRLDHPQPSPGRVGDEEPPGAARPERCGPGQPSSS
jgi:hypothetical protein